MIVTLAGGLVHHAKASVDAVPLFFVFEASYRAVADVLAVLALLAELLHLVMEQACVKLARH